MVLGHLRDAAASWESWAATRGTLYRGARLEVALDVATAASASSRRVERDFLDTSRSERDRERQERPTRRPPGPANRRLRVQLAAIAIALVVALVGGSIALDQRRGRPGRASGDRP